MAHPALTWQTVEQYARDLSAAQPCFAFTLDADYKNSFAVFNKAVRISRYFDAPQEVKAYLDALDWALSITEVK